MIYRIKKTKLLRVSDGTVQSPVRYVRRAEDAFEIFRTTLAGLPHEEMHVLYLASNLRVISFEVVAKGGTCGVSVSPGDILRGAIMAGAASIILAHNHPSGDPTPSAEDLRMTSALRSVCNISGISLIDHIVVCPEEGERGEFRSIVDVIDLAGAVS